jgi:hypothetical protein
MFSERARESEAAENTFMSYSLPADVSVSLP